jgi:hypothetical protein
MKINQHGLQSIKRLNIYITVACLCLAVIAQPLPCYSKDKTDSFIMDTDGIGRAEGGYITSDQFLEMGVPTADGLRMEGEQSLRIGDLNRAITVLQRSVEMSPSDLDGRVLYAEALEKKLMKQKEKDPALFNFLVKQWFFVFKSAEFLDETTLAVEHLTLLTGTSPKRLEKPEKFLGRVLIPEDGSVKVALGDDFPKSKEKE